jgi:MarR family transcriptional regulator, 2-MHQ and catechol-resistance regulon repressor
MPTHYQGTAREKRALDTFVKLIRAGNTVSAESSRRLSEHGLTISQFAVLEALYHVGPMCLRELAQKILRTAGNLTMVLDNLEKRGLAKRIASEKDRRYITAEITPRGRDLIRRVFPEHAARIADAMGRLSPREQEELAALCRKLGGVTPSE